MDFSTARSERITAMISTVVAVVILAGGVTAYQSHHAANDDVVQLESDFRFQLEVGFRHNVRERARRLTQLDKVSKAWQQSPKSDADREKLADWLLEATIRSMPGAVEELPAIPVFGATQPEVKKPKEPLPIQPTLDILDDPPLSAREADLQVEQKPEIAPVPTASVPAPLPAAETPQVAQPAVSSSPPPERPIEIVPSNPTATNPTNDDVVTEQLPQPVASAPLPVQVNLSELAARIAGYNAGLDEVEFALSRIKSDDFRSLSKQINELEQLSRDYQFVSLYYQLLEESERRWVAKPRELSSTIEVLQRRIDAAQESLSGDFLDDFDANNPDRLGKLRQQLAELTSGVNR